MNRFETGAIDYRISPDNLVEVQEFERTQIARELHDEIGQALTGLKLLLETCARLPNDHHDTLRANMHEAQAIVEELINQVRDMSLNLRPAMLDDLGLLPALIWYFERYKAQTGIYLIFKHSDIERKRFSKEIEITVYRIVQEALTNVARHARVNQVTVRIWINQNQNQNAIEVQIEDYGVGFDLESVLSSGEFGGLIGIKERVGLLGGRLTIESNLRAGTRLTAELPLGGWLERRKALR